MAYDKGLETRIDELTERWERLEKKRMFGGICYLNSGNMALGIWKDHLIVRCGPEHHAECLRRKHAKEFDITGKPMSGWIMVAPEGIEEDDDLTGWIQVGYDFSASLAPKRKKQG